jgi:hypothetical protein
MYLYLPQQMAVEHGMELRRQMAAVRHGSQARRVRQHRRWQGSAKASAGRDARH